MPPERVSWKNVFLVHFLGVVGVADEDQVHLAVLAGEEEIEQREEALGEILLVLVHRRRHIHEAEHDRARDRLRLPDAVAIAKVDLVQEREPAAATRAGDRARRATPRPGRACPAATASVKAASTASASRSMPPESAMRRASDCRSVRITERLAGTPDLVNPARMLLLRSVCPISVRARFGSSRSSKKICMNSSRDSENTKSSSLPPSPPLLPPPPLPEPSGRGMLVAGDVFAVARQHELAVAAAAETERGLGNVLSRHADLAALLHVGEPPLADHLLHRGFDLRLVPAQEPLAVHRALAASVRPAVDEVEHRRSRRVRPVRS